MQEWIKAIADGKRQAREQQAEAHRASQDRGEQERLVFLRDVDQLWRDIRATIQQDVDDFNECVGRHEIDVNTEAPLEISVERRGSPARYLWLQLDQASRKILVQSRAHPPGEEMKARAPASQTVDLLVKDDRLHVCGLGANPTAPRTVQEFARELMEPYFKGL